MRERALTPRAAPWDIRRVLREESSCMPFGKTPADWARQRTLLAGLPRSSVLRAVTPPAGARRLRLRCERSMPFEFVSEFVGPFMSLWDAQLELSVSDYDPSLAGALRPGRDEDVLLLWIDWRLHRAMPPADAARWIANLVASHRSGSGRGVPVLINDWPQGAGAAEIPDAWVSALGQALEEAARTLPDCHLVRLERLRKEECPAFFDPRNDLVAHHPFSQAATIHVARHLGAQLLPALLMPRLKVVAVDLDHTLYEGVLGEDGPGGIQVGPGHRSLQRQLLRLKEAGFILALCSRNERADVEALFSQRKDFALSLSDFAAVRVDWNSKPQNLRSIAAQLNLHPSAVLFVDDNPAELAQVAEWAPEVELVLADPAGEATAAILARHPGLFRLRADAISALRTEDLRANQAREQLRTSAASPEEYLARLAMVVDLFENHREHAARIHELSNKTNQFNLCMARFTEQDVDRLFRPGNLTFTVGLRDALADSGIVAVVAFEISGRDARLVEFLVSCRALGRDVEGVAFGRALDRLAQLGCERLELRAKEGPRNRPALEFLRRFVPGGERVVPFAGVREAVGRAIRCHPAEVRVH
jgi:FkbH-like protein